MSIFGTNLFESVYTVEENIDTNVEYDMDELVQESAEISYELSESLHKIEAATYIADIMIESAVTEGAENVEALVESTMKERFQKMKKAFMDFLKKIKDWFKKIFTAITNKGKKTNEYIKQNENEIKQKLKKEIEKGDVIVDLLFIEPFPTSPIKKFEILVNRVNLEDIFIEISNTYTETELNTMIDKLRNTEIIKALLPNSGETIEEYLNKMLYKNEEKIKSIDVTDISPSAMQTLNIDIRMANHGVRFAEITLGKIERSIKYAIEYCENRIDPKDEISKSMKRIDEELGNPGYDANFEMKKIQMFNTMIVRYQNMLSIVFNDYNLYINKIMQMLSKINSFKDENGIID